MSKVILHLCADTGSDTQVYQDDDDYEVVLVGAAIGVENFSVASWLHYNGLDKQIYGVIANPPCTEFSRARTSGKPRLGDSGMFLVKECQRIIEEAKSLGGLKFWAIENPATGALRNFLGKPQATYKPWQYGSPWGKQTALWGEFNMPPIVYNTWEEVPDKIPELWIRSGRKIPSLVYQHKSAYKLIPEFQDLPEPDSDMEFRSLCSQKFARAFKAVNP
mgnify:CR=1 FL=1